MSQRPHFEAGAMPADISEGLDAGCYLAQVRGSGDIAILFATAEAAPEHANDWFQAGPGEAFTFRAGAGLLPTWVRTDPRLSEAATVTVARARTGA